MGAPGVTGEECLWPRILPRLLPPGAVPEEVLEVGVVAVAVTTLQRLCLAGPKEPILGPKPPLDHLLGQVPPLLVAGFGRLYGQADGRVVDPMLHAPGILPGGHGGLPGQLLRIKPDALAYPAGGGVAEIVHDSP